MNIHGRAGRVAGRHRQLRSGCCRSPAAGEFTLTANKLSFNPAYLACPSDSNERWCGRRAPPMPRRLRHRPLCRRLDWRGRPRLCGNVVPPTPDERATRQIDPGSIFSTSPRGRGLHAALRSPTAPCGLGRTAVREARTGIARYRPRTDQRTERVRHDPRRGRSPARRWECVCT